MSVLLLCRSNRGHSAADGSLSTGGEIVTWILNGAIVHVEIDAAIVRGSLQLDHVAVSKRMREIDRNPQPRAAGRASSGSQIADEVMLQRVVEKCVSHLDTNAGDEDCT